MSYFVYSRIVFNVYTHISNYEIITVLFFQDNLLVRRNSEIILVLAKGNLCFDYFKCFSISKYISLLSEILMEKFHF